MDRYFLKKKKKSLVGNILNGAFPPSPASETYIVYAVLKIRTIYHAWELWKLCLVNSSVYYACQTSEIYQVLPCTQWISKLPGSFEIHWVRQYLVNVVLFWNKDLKWV